MKKEGLSVLSLLYKMHKLHSSYNYVLRTEWVVLVPNWASYQQANLSQYSSRLLLSLCFHYNRLRLNQT